MYKTLNIRVGEFVSRQIHWRSSQSCDVADSGIFVSYDGSRNVLLCRMAHVDAAVSPKNVVIGSPIGRHVTFALNDVNPDRDNMAYKILDLIDGHYRLMDVSEWVPIEKCRPWAGGGVAVATATQDPLKELHDRLEAAMDVRGLELFDKIFERLEAAETDAVYWKEKYHGVWGDGAVVKWAVVDTITGLIYGIWISQYEALGQGSCLRSKVVPVVEFNGNGLGLLWDIRGQGLLMSGQMPGGA